MIFETCAVAGAYVITPEPHSDERGSFARAWCQNEFTENGLSFRPLQANRGISAHQGTMRGVHFQKAPDLEAKLVWCTRGSVFDVAVDTRTNSTTFGKWFGAELTPENGKMLFIPESCGHGCLSLEDDTEIYYLASAFYAPHSATGIRFDDPAFGVEWPIPVTHLSAQDLNWPAWVAQDS